MAKPGSSGRSSACLQRAAGDLIQRGGAGAEIVERQADAQQRQLVSDSGPALMVALSVSSRQIRLGTRSRRGMLSAVVIRRDLKPPDRGFFEMAKQHGWDVTDEVEC